MSVSVQVATPMHALRVGGQVYHYTSSPYHLKTRSLAGPEVSHFSYAPWPWSSGIHLSPPTNSREEGTYNPAQFLMWVLGL